MSIPLSLQNLSLGKKSPTSRSKANKQSLPIDASSTIFTEISHKLYDIKNLNPKKKIVILDEFSIPDPKGGFSEDIEGAITSRYEPV